MLSQLASHKQTSSPFLISICFSLILIINASDDYKNGQIGSEFHFDPAEEIYVDENQEVTVTFNVCWNGSDDTHGGWLFVSVVPSFRVELLGQHSFLLTSAEVVDGFNGTLILKGVTLGHAKLEFYWQATETSTKIPRTILTPRIIDATRSTLTTLNATLQKSEMPPFSEHRNAHNDNQWMLLSKTYQVHVRRTRGFLDNAFVIILGTLVTINTLMMGCEMDMLVVKEVLKKPIGPVVGFISQFVFMPLASFAFGQLLIDDSHMQLGFFIIGTSPGGQSSNFFTLLLGGDLNLSVTMTVISLICALFMMPFWVYTLGDRILTEGNIVVPIGGMMSSLVGFCVPVTIGLAIKNFRPGWAALIKKVVVPYTIIMTIFVNALFLSTSTFVFSLMTWRIMLVGTSIGYSGYIFGLIFAWACRMSRPQIIAVSLETAIQNGGIAFMVLMLTLSQPDADLTSVAPLTQMLTTGCPLILVYCCLKLYQRIRRKYKSKTLEKNEINQEQEQITETTIECMVQEAKV